MDPYAYGWERTHSANQLQDIYKHLGNGEESKTDGVSIAGRIVARRAFGKLAFLTLRDDSGTIQVWELGTCSFNNVHVLACLLILDGNVSFLLSSKTIFSFHLDKTKIKS